MTAKSNFDSMRKLSPRRNSTEATDLDGLVDEQLQHFSIDPHTDFGQSLGQIVRRVYESQSDIDRLWQITMDEIRNLDAPERISHFNAKKFLSFQLAKLLDTLQNPFRRSYE